MNRISRRDLIEIILSLSVLVLCSSLLYTAIFLRPFVGFNFVGTTGVISDVFYTDSTGAQVQVGDRILQVGSEIFEPAYTGNEHGQVLFSNLKPGDLIPLTVERKGQILTLNQVYSGPTQKELAARVTGIELLPALFWLAGAATLLFIRPRSNLTFLMSLFFYITAICLGAGIVSAFHDPWGALLMRLGMWLAIPIYWHFLWYFPSSLGRIPKAALYSVYGLGGLLAAAQLANLLPNNAYMLGFIVSLLGGLALIGVHVRVHPGERKILAGMLVALLIVFVPILVMNAAAWLFPVSEFSVVAPIGYSALPGYFFFTLFQRQVIGQSRLVSRLFKAYLAAIGVIMAASFFPILISAFKILQTIRAANQVTLFFVICMIGINFSPFLILPALARSEIHLPGLNEEMARIRANRMVPLVFFYMILFFIAILLYSGLVSWIGAEWNGFIAALFAVLIAAAALTTYPPFERFFQRIVLGMPIHPNAILEEYSGRILTSLNADSLRSLITSHLLPSLLVRQSALVSLSPFHQPVAFLLYGIPPEQAPGKEETLSLLEYSEAHLLPGRKESSPGWVRLVVPLKLGEKITGVWLFGARDPDDLYTSDDTHIFSILAGQTALALENIDQTENLRALYRVSARSQDTERMMFAAELHDDVLNSLAILGSSLNTLNAPPDVIGSYRSTITHLRQVIYGLRPAMLNFGLYYALQAMVDELKERIPADGPEIRFEVEASQARYDSQVELNLFRIVQQGCQNAIQHAEGSLLVVKGYLVEQHALLEVQDNGKGLNETRKKLNLPSLLAEHHFGLAGMLERATLINADLLVTSDPGQGTRIQVEWQE